MELNSVSIMLSHLYPLVGVGGGRGVGFLVLVACFSGISPAVIYIDSVAKEGNDFTCIRLFINLHISTELFSFRSDSSSHS